MPSWMFFSATICGKKRGLAPNMSTPPFSSSSDTPMAVMSADSRGDFRTGLYASRSITMPISAHRSMLVSRTSRAFTGLEVDEPQDAVDQRGPERDERLHAAPGHAIDQRVEQLAHAWRRAAGTTP